MAIGLITLLGLKKEKKVLNLSRLIQPSEALPGRLGQRRFYA